MMNSKPDSGHLCDTKPPVVAEHEVRRKGLSEGEWSTSSRWSHSTWGTSGMG